MCRGSTCAVICCKLIWKGATSLQHHLWRRLIILVWCIARGRVCCRMLSISKAMTNICQDCKFLGIVEQPNWIILQEDKQELNRGRLEQNLPLELKELRSILKTSHNNYQRRGSFSPLTPSILDKLSEVWRSVDTNVPM